MDTVIDLHAHVLPGVDDGPRRLEESLDLARAAVASGTRILCATPHIDHRLMVDPFEVAPRTGRLQAELRRAGIPLQLVPSGELAPARAGELSDEELGAVTLGFGRWLLLECPLQPLDLTLEPVAAQLLARGWRLVLAHPERSPLFLRDPDRVSRLVERGCLCAITASAVSGSFGTSPRRLALRLLADGLAHALASDAHDARQRPPGIGDALADAEPALRGVEALGPWLCYDVPRAVIAGRDAPPRPAVQLRRPLLRRS